MQGLALHSQLPAACLPACPRVARCLASTHLPQFFKDGAALPATVIALEAGNIVTQVKSAEKDGYTAVQVRPLLAASGGRKPAAGSAL